MIINGCTMNFKIEDKDFLKTISDENAEILSLEFISKNEKDGIVLVKVKVKTKDYECFRTFIGNLRANIIKTLITMDITDFSVDDKIDYKLENKKEIKRKGLPQKMCREIDCTFFIPFPKIKKVEFEDKFKTIWQSNRKLKDTMFWLYMTYSLRNTGKGLIKNEALLQYRLLWTGFNNLYALLYPEFSRNNRKCLEMFSQESYTVDCFKYLLSNSNYAENLNELAQAELKLKNKENVSQKLHESLNENNHKEISKNTLLCLYAIRNKVIHGSPMHETLCRTAFNILTLLINRALNNFYDDTAL